MTTLEFNNDSIILKDSNTNLYTCNTCSYYTPLRNSFIKHLKTDKHKINENPLECEHCNKYFHTKLSYNNHVKSCMIPEINENDAVYENNIDVDENPQHDDKEGDPNEDVSLLLSKFGNEYNKLTIKYVLAFFSLVKENVAPVNVLLIVVFLMWMR
jgi:hypothetical protein